MFSLSRRSLLATGAAAVGASIAGCLESDPASLETTSPEPGSWPFAHYDAANSSYNPHANPPASEPESRWRLETDVEFDGLLVADGTVVGYGDGGVRALESGTGDALWSRDGEVHVAGISDETVYTAGFTGGDGDDSGKSSGRITALALEDGEIEWTATGDDYRWFGSLLVAEDVVVAAGALDSGMNDTRTVAFDRATGDAAWTLESGGVAGLFGTSLFARGPGAFSRYDPDDSALPWSDASPESAWSADTFDSLSYHPPAISHRGLFAGAAASGLRDGRAAASRYDRSSGQMRWSAEPRGIWASTPALADGVGYVGQTEPEPDRGHVAGIDLVDGGERWHVEVDGRITKTVAAGDVALAFGETERDGDGRLFAFDRDGAALWDLEFDTAPGRRGVVAVEETVLVATEGGELLALEAS